MMMVLILLRQQHHDTITYTLQSMQTYGLYNMDITPMDEFGRNIDEGKNFLNRTFAKFNVKFNKAFTYNAMFQYEYGADRTSLNKRKRIV